MVNSKSPDSAGDGTYLRKIRKPLVEKKRRDRMNNSLAQLKSLLAVNIKQSSTSAMARLDKADILEITVSHLTTLQHQHRSISLATAADSYKKGFKDCARETFNYISSTQALDADSLHRLNNHLHSCYTEKTKQRSAATCTLNSTEVTSAHVRSGQDLYSSANTYLTATYTEKRSTLIPAYDNVYSHAQKYRGKDCYTELNDSVDTSLNSSCDTSLMSVDSSTSVTPEKIIPTNSMGANVWRPW